MDNNAPRPVHYQTRTRRAVPAARRSPIAIWITIAFLIAIVAYLFWPRWRSDTTPAWVERIASVNTMNQVALWLNEFHKEYGYFPTGGNRATVAALKGDDTTANPRQQFFFYIQKTSGGGPVLSPAGQLVDGWRRPLIIRGGGTTRPIVYSVGPNGIDDGGEGDDILPEDPSAPPRRVVPNLNPARAATYPATGARP